MESNIYAREDAALHPKPHALSLAIKGVALAAGITLSLSAQATELDSEEAAPEIATGIQAKEMVTAKNHMVVAANPWRHKPVMRC